ncbi:LEAP-2A [Scophthalmus maximus]|uniref:LEAP-2A n=1 Tax=Scophthalmus maximus TaxID=52904 RepID=A0A2U9B0G6_SCOMX|nr:liver-expressed antimicrobial peptide 2 [Scophthalmus maximus]AWO97386.1 LEAP-2A [Scophthalmus maximus]
MQEKRSLGQRNAAAALCVVLLVLAQQVCAGPLAPRAASGSDQSPDSRGEAGGVRAPRRVARMTPLWRTMNSKPLGAYCQSNYECSTGLCRAGHCSTSQRSLSGAVTY